MRSQRAAKPGSYYTGCNEALLKAVPETAQTILEVGCGQGQLGATLKAQRPGRQVIGIEVESHVAKQAQKHLDQVFVLDVESESIPLPPGSVDCIVYGDVLEHMYNPQTVLRKHRPLLSANGVIVCSISNIQHHSMLRAILTGDFQYTHAGLLDNDHMRFFTWSTTIKLLLDAGYAPNSVASITTPIPDAFWKTMKPALKHLRLPEARTKKQVGTYQYIVKGIPYAAGEAAAMASLNDEAINPLTFVVCVSDQESLKANLLSSPCLQKGHRHEILMAGNCDSAAAGLNHGLESARNDLVVCLHQDVYLPRNWDRQFVGQYQLAQRRFGAIGVAGVYGVRGSQAKRGRAGHVFDRDVRLCEGVELPVLVDTLDELLLAVPKSTPLRFDPELGFHFYGADICRQAKQKGLPSVALEALCFHNSRSVGVDDAFWKSGERFASKWRSDLPLATSCVEIDEQGRMRLI